MTERVNIKRFEEELLLLESTSPSYVLMASHAMNVKILEEHGEMLMRSWIKDLGDFRSTEKKREQDEGGVRLVELPGSDLTKIVLDFSDAGMDAEEGEKRFIEAGVYPEFSSGDIMLLMTGIGNVPEDYELLVDAIKSI